MLELNPHELPEYLLVGKSDETKWLLRSAFEHTTQNATILKRLEEMNGRQEAHEQNLTKLSDRVDSYDQLKQKFSGGKIALGLIVSFIGGVIVVPLMCAFFISWVEHWTIWKK